MDKGRVHKLNDSISTNPFFNKFNFSLQNKLFDSPIFSRIRLLSMKKKPLKRTAALINERLNDAKKSVYIQWYLMTLDIIDYKIIQHLV